MRRSPIFDPPEYLDWRADPAEVRAFRARIDGDAERSRIVAALDEDARLALYAGLVRFRLHDYALKRWVRQGVISKAWLGTGEEAVTIGAVHALERSHDVVAPMIRNAGALHEMGMPLVQCLCSYLATTDSPNHGRDGHVGDLGSGVIAPISHVGDMVPVVAGVALSFRQRGESRVALTWIGDGSTKTGVVHEGLNLAGVLRVPAVFVLQNNQVALGTRVEQHQRGDFRAWPKMYGLNGLSADGNNVLDVFAATRLAADHARAGGGPTLLVAETFRMGGHATHDEAEARGTFAPELFAQWGARDPIGLYEAYLEEEGVHRAQLEAIESEIAAAIDAAVEAAVQSRAEHMPAAASAELEGFSAGVRQPGLAGRGVTS
ncbi:MAG: thiamine pyrophosphate-dependent dehydrogenase E1 component subunit alpha [Longimicrobiales bacterium]